MTYRTRPEMTRRSPPDPSAEQGAKDHAAMMERLKVLTGDRKPIERLDPALPNDPVKPITQTVTLPQGVDTTPILEWHKPVQHPNGEATQTSTGGHYAVFGRRGPQGFTFTPQRGLEALGSPCKTAEDARMKCLLHYLEACGT